MKRIGILTAGGDTPAMNATIQGAVVRANQLKLEIFGLIKGFNSLFQPARSARSSQPALSAKKRGRTPAICRGEFH
jgi:6-phosphofructokinase